MKLDISNIQWFVDDGYGDFPPAEVYIAPIENNSNGDLLVSNEFLKFTTREL